MKMYFWELITILITYKLMKFFFLKEENKIEENLEKLENKKKNE